MPSTTDICIDPAACAAAVESRIPPAELTASIVDAMTSLLIALDHDGKVVWWNPRTRDLLGWNSNDQKCRPLTSFGEPWNDPRIVARLAEEPAAGKTLAIDRLSFTRGDRTTGVLALRVIDMAPPTLGRGGRLIMASDVTERLQLEVQLTQAQKLESIGQLAAGIAHEINTPTQYVGDNLRFLVTAFKSMSDAITTLTDSLKAAVAAESTLNLPHALAKVEEEDLPYLLEEVPKALAQAIDGVARTTKIVLAMKDCSHPATNEFSPTDINHALDSTATVARNEWKYVADLVTEYDPAMPPVPCLVNEMNQVFLNIFVNAAHAVADALKARGETKGVIRVRTRHDDRWAIIEIEDSGTGIPKEIQDKIFDPFFTTKPVGKGTGQGLAIVRNVVVKKHHGKIDVKTEVGKGTTFTIKIPLFPVESDPERRR